MGPSRVRWDRIGRVALVLVLFGVLVSYLNPVVNLVDAWRDSKAGEERLVELKGENVRLRDNVERAGSRRRWNARPASSAWSSPASAHT